MNTVRKTRLFGALCLSAIAFAGCSKSNENKKLVVGFSQVGAESGWRSANTDSIKGEADKRGNIELKFDDAQQKQENQIKAIRDFIGQHVDYIVFSPVESTGWAPVLGEAKAAGIPVIIEDRRADVSDDLYATFIGSDFIEEGKKAGDWLKNKTGGNAKIVELSGTPGSAPANDRAKGFRDAIAASPGMQIIVSQTGNFTRAQGKSAMESILKTDAGKTMTALFVHNDDMAIGAIQAMEEAGLKPGKDITIVSCDAEKAAFEAIIDGKMNCTVECNPLLGPPVFDAIESLAAGKTLDKRVVAKEGVFDETNAKTEMPSRQY